VLPAGLPGSKAEPPALPQLGGGLHPLPLLHAFAGQQNPPDVSVWRPLVNKGRVRSSHPRADRKRILSPKGRKKSVLKPLKQIGRS